MATKGKMRVVSGHGFELKGNSCLYQGMAVSLTDVSLIINYMYIHLLDYH